VTELVDWYLALVGRLLKESLKPELDDVVFRFTPNRPEVDGAMPNESPNPDGDFCGALLEGTPKASMLPEGFGAVGGFCLGCSPVTCSAAGFAGC
jgi:hypothetical protein